MFDDYYCTNLCEYRVNGKCTDDEDKCLDISKKELVKLWLEAEGD